VFVVGIGIRKNIERKSGKEQNLLNQRIKLISIGIVPFLCMLSLLLGIGSAVPTPWIKPTINDISGEWTLSTCTTRRFKEQWSNFPEHAGMIEFKDDQTFTVENLPALWELQSYSNLHDGIYISSGSGKWYLKQSSGRIGGNEWILYAQFREINKMTDNRLIGFYFNGHVPPYSLAYSDNINLIILTKGAWSLENYICS